MAIFQDDPDKPVPECLHSGFYRSKDDEDRLTTQKGLMTTTTITINSFNGP